MTWKFDSRSFFLREGTKRRWENSRELSSVFDFSRGGTLAKLGGRVSTGAGGDRLVDWLVRSMVESQRRERMLKRPVENIPSYKERRSCGSRTGKESFHFPLSSPFFLPFSQLFPLFTILSLSLSLSLFLALLHYHLFLPLVFRLLHLCSARPFLRPSSRKHGLSFSIHAPSVWSGF